MRRINFGVWGYGRMGERHGTFYAMESERFALVAACDTDEARLASATAAHGCATYTCAQEFLADDAMELVVISTLSLDHTRHAVDALEAGKYVLLDKPIAITDAELATLRRADQAHPGKLSVLHNLRFEPGFEAVQDVVAQGLLGDVNMIKLRRHHQDHYFRADWQTMLEYGGGLLNNWGNHEIDHAVQLLGSHPVDVWSQLWHLSAAGSGDDHVKVLLKSADDRVADVEISYNVAVSEPYCTVHGHRGTVICNAAMTELHLRYIDPAYTIPEVTLERDLTTYRNSLENEIPWVEETRPVTSHGNMWEYIDRKLIRYLYDEITTGTPSPITNSDAFETVRIIQDVKRQNPQFDWIV